MSEPARTAPHRRVRRRRAVGIAVTAVLLTSAGFAITSPAAAAPSGHFAVNRPLCGQPARPTEFRCFAMERVDVAAGTRGAYAFAAVGHGVRGGYTPADLAKAYAYDPRGSSSQTVAVIDWYDDPKALGDLNVFDHKYGLPSETSRSFGKVNQFGASSPLPNGNAGNNHSSSPEIALDVESVRAVCHKCRILLVEASRPSAADLTVAENTAVRLGATEISNSFGGAESSAPTSMINAFRHPGVVITASTGDDGWYGWDGWNFAQDHFDTDGEAPFPASDPYVVAVGGTTLSVNANGTRHNESVWNNNGFDDKSGFTNSIPEGASGGGCSARFSVPSWQGHVAGYSAAGCSSKRLTADVAAVANPRTGLDVFDSYTFAHNGHQGWVTIGGTSLSSPVTAALFALAGGSGGSAYPAASLYVNSALHGSSALFDVTAGGNGFCGGDTTANCSVAASQILFSGTNNPNQIPSSSLLDCSFPTHGDVVVAPPKSSECNAVPGYDGATGVGTPKGLGLFRHTSPTASIGRPAIMKLHTSQAFIARVHESVAGAQPTKYAWNWGDGHSDTTASAAIHHTFSRAGHYTVTLTVGDSLHQYVVRKSTLAVGLKPSVRLAGASTLRVGHRGYFTAKGTTDPNTGGAIRTITWTWGDGAKTTGTSATHVYHHEGSYAITLTVVDNSGVRTSMRHRVAVTG